MLNKNEIQLFIKKYPKNCNMFMTQWYHDVAKSEGILDSSSSLQSLDLNKDLEETPIWSQNNQELTVTISNGVLYDIKLWELDEEEIGRTNFSPSKEAINELLDAEQIQYTLNPDSEFDYITNHDTYILVTKDDDEYVISTQNRSYEYFYSLEEELSIMEDHTLKELKKLSQTESPQITK